MTTGLGLEDAPMSTMASLVNGNSERREWLWRSGSLAPWAESTVHVNAVGHASVAAIFEGIKAYVSHDGQRLLIFRLEEHLERMYTSPRIVRLKIPYGIETLRSAVIGT